VLRRDGTYVRAWQAAGKRKSPAPGFNAQEFLLALAEGKQNIAAIPPSSERKPVRRITRKERKTS
jgi:hypothetical protein